MKKLFLITLILCCGLLFLSACGQEEPADPVTEPYQQNTTVPETKNEEAEVSYEELPDPVMISADFGVVANGDGTFIIETNLPSETELMLKLKGRGYLAQGKATVSDGTAVSDRFTDKGNQLAGDFTLEVLMPIPNVQSDYVKHFIGTRGEYLTGPYVEGALGSVVVRKEFSVSFTGNAGDPGTVAGISQDQVNPDADGYYYRTPTGERYHLDPNCGGANSYRTNDISGLTPCAKCAS